MRSLLLLIFLLHDLYGIDTVSILMSIVAMDEDQDLISESDNESKSSAQETSLNNELAEIPLGELQQLREKIGTKKFDIALQNARDKRNESSFKRANKNRPREVSSKKPVSRFREVIHVPKQDLTIRDPRFNEASGHLNLDLFKKTYSFMDELKKSEKQVLLKEAKKTKDEEKKSQIQKLLQKMESRELAEQKEQERSSLLREHKKAERELIKKGKRPFYVKKSTQKKLLLAKKFTELKKSGKLEKFLTKKRKKNTHRDRKQLPFRRSAPQLSS